MASELPRLGEPTSPAWAPPKNEAAQRRAARQAA